MLFVLINLNFETEVEIATLHTLLENLMELEQPRIALEVEIVLQFRLGPLVEANEPHGRRATLEQASAATTALRDHT